MIPCNRCGSPSIVHQRYSGLHLCQSHFEEDVLRKVRESLRGYRIFGRGGLIAVAMSGGKDSSTLLYILKKIFEKRPDITLSALLIDEGIAGYRDATLEEARRLADKMDVPHETLSFRDEYQITTDEIASQGHIQAPCTYCGVLRKSLLNRAARNMGAIALATGHNLDDEVQTIMMNYLKGDIDRLFRLYPRSPKDQMVPRVKPLRRIPEKEVAIFAMTHHIFPSRTGSCPNVPKAMRLEIKEMLNDLEASHPGTKYSILRGFERILKLQPDNVFQPTPCVRCGEPTELGLCQSCKLRDQIRTKAFKSG